jgi:hypothetical protein
MPQPKIFPCGKHCGKRPPFFTEHKYLVKVFHRIPDFFHSRKIFFHRKFRVFHRFSTG